MGAGAGGDGFGVAGRLFSFCVLGRVAGSVVSPRFTLVRGGGGTSSVAAFALGRFAFTGRFAFAFALALRFPF